MITLITGASGALGSALAESLAAPGQTLLLQGRNTELLELLAETCRSKGAEVHIDAFDLCDQVLRAQWLDHLTEGQLPDQVFANAGMNAHAEAGCSFEPWHKTEQLLDLNVKATLHIAQTLGEAMKKRGQGHFILISSLAAWYGLPVTPAYSASKAAVKVYGEAMRALLAPHGVNVTVVMPGYFDSPMCRDMPGPKPWVWSASRAADFILRRLRRNPARIAFPFWLNTGCWLLAVVPAWVSERALKLLGYQQ